MSNFYGFLQIPVIFSCWPEASMASSWLCILLIPLLITFFHCSSWYIFVWTLPKFSSELWRTFPPIYKGCSFQRSVFPGGCRHFTALSFSVFERLCFLVPFNHCLNPLPGTFHLPGNFYLRILWCGIKYLSQDGSLYFAHVKTGQPGTWSLAK